MSLRACEKGYHTLQLSGTLHQYNYALKDRLTATLIKRAEKVPADAGQCRDKAMELGFFSGMRRGMSLCDQPFYDNIQISCIPLLVGGGAILGMLALINQGSCDPQVMAHFDKVSTWILLVSSKVSIALVAANLAVGSGTAIHDSYLKNPKLRAAEKVISRYGVLGIPQWAAFSSYEHARAKLPLLAGACLLAAGLLGLAVEPLRCVAILVNIVGRSSFMVIYGAYQALSSYNKADQHPGINPLRYIDGIDDIRAHYKQDFFEAKPRSEPKPGKQRYQSRRGQPSSGSGRYQAPPRPAQEPKASAPSGPDLTNWKVLNDEVSEALRLFSPVVKAASKDQRRQLLIKLLSSKRIQDNTKQAEWYDEVAKNLDIKGKSLRSGFRYIPSDAQVLKAKHEQNKDELGIIWLATKKHYFSYILRLHDDKVEDPKYPLSPEVKQLLSNTVNMVTSARNLGEILEK